MLLKGGANADPNETDKEGDTLLHTTDSPELMAALLTRGGDPNVMNKVRGLLLARYHSYMLFARAHYTHPPSTVCRLARRRSKRMRDLRG